MSGHCMKFPDTFDEFVKECSFKDTEEIYTNGAELIPVFRVKQWLEHVETKKEAILDDIFSSFDALKEHIISCEECIHGMNDRKDYILHYNKMESRFCAHAERTSSKEESNFG